MATELTLEAYLGERLHYVMALQIWELINTLYTANDAIRDLGSDWLTGCLLSTQVTCCLYTFCEI